VVARQVVAAAASVEPTFRDERIDDLRIAVSEATTNAIEAHTDLDSVDRIKIRCDLGDDRIEVEVLDEGGGFDPDAVDAAPEATDPDRLEWESGLGIPLMQEFADETEIRPTRGGTAVRLVVYKRRRA
jgi:serine/threonine-protein kinase RsbW